MTIDSFAPLFPSIVAATTPYAYMVNVDYIAYFMLNSASSKAITINKNGFSLAIDISTSQLHYCASAANSYAVIGMQAAMNPLATVAAAKDNIVTYLDAWANTDLQFIAFNGRLKETLLCRAVSASSNPSLTAYLEYAENIYFTNTLTINANGANQALNTTFVTSGQINFNDSNGVTQFSFPVPTVFDSAKNTVAGIYRATVNNGVLMLNILVPIAFINSAVFPIYIDPTTDTVGDTSNDFGAGNNGYVFGDSITASESGTLTSVGVYLATVAGNVRCAIFSGYNGTTGFTGLLGQSASTTAINGWNDLTIPGSVSIVQGNTYYIAFQVDNAATSFYYSNSGSTAYYATFSYGVFTNPTAIGVWNTNLNWYMRMIYSSVVNITISDVGAGSDSLAFLQANISLSADSGSGVDSVALLAHMIAPSTDTGSGSDALASLNVNVVPSADAGVGADAVAALNAAVAPVNDSGSGLDAIQALTAQVAPAADSGQGLDSAASSTAISVSDIGVGIDLTAGLVGYWNLDTGSGTIAYDSSGNGNNGTLQGSPLPSWVTGKYGNALSFNPSNTNYIEISSIKGLLGLTGITISAWVYMNITTDQCLWFVTLPGGNTGTFRTANSTGLYLTNAIGTQSGYSQWSAGNSPSIGTWQFLTATYDGSNLNVYKNGILSKSTPWIGGTLKDITGIRIGGSFGSAGYFNGVIDEVQIYNRALSAQEISYLYNSIPPYSMVSVGVQVPIVDAGSGSDAVASLQANLPLSDVGSGVDSLASFKVMLLIADSGLGSDAFVNLTGQIPLSDLGVGADNLSLQAFVVLSDVGSGLDFVSVQASFVLPDSAVALDVIGVVQLVSSADLGVGADVIRVYTPVVLNDASDALDAVVLYVFKMPTVPIKLQRQNGQVNLESDSDRKPSN